MNRFWLWLLAVAVLCVVVRAAWPTLLLIGIGWLLYKAVSGPMQARHRERAALVARADYQHQLVMRGNPAGIYGLYPPHKLPTIDGNYVV